MNELAHYLDRYFAELEAKDALADAEIGFCKDIIRGVWESHQGCYGGCNELIILENRGEKGIKGLSQCRELIEVGR